MCNCPPLWNGVNCETWDATFPGGPGEEVRPPTTTMMPPNKERELCRELGCEQKAGNGICDVSFMVVCKSNNYGDYLC